MPFKPVDTALKIIVGPAIDDTDFKSREETLTYDQAGIEVDVILEKHDGTIVTTAVTPTTAGDYDWVHTDQGYYSLELSASGGASFNNTEEGIITVAVFCTGVLPFGSVSYDVVPTAVYDSLVKGTDKLQTDIVQIGGVTQSATDFKDMVDTGYDPSTHKIQSDLIYIHGSALTETAGQLAAAFTKLFDVATPLLVASEVMRGTESALTDKAGFSLLSTGADLILKNSVFALAIADAVADEEYTGATHNVINSLGRRVREIGAFAIHSGTAQAGTSHSITLAATADANDGVYNRNLIVLVDNTGVSQTRTIVDYNGTTKIAIIDRDWRISPDATTTYQITPDNTPLVVDQGIAQAGTSTTITLRSYASAINDNYLCNIVIIIAGTGRGQARLVGSYVGSTKVVTICGDNWVTAPDNTSVYVMVPYGATCASCINDHALGQINTEVDNALNTDIPGSPTAGSINQRTKAIDELTEASGSGDLAAILIDTATTIPGTIATLQTDSTAIKAKTDNLPSGITKNVALPKFTFYIVLSSDHVTGAAGKTIVGEISKDGGAFAAITNTITEVGDGLYVITSGFTQAEMNADVINLKFTETDCDQRTITIYTT